MFAILGSVLFLIVLVMSILVALGLPLGEFTMGGQYKILPKKYRVMAIVSVGIQLLGIITILQASSFIPLFFSLSMTKYICFFFAIYLSLNTIMNLTSKSKKEKYFMTPLSFIAAICFWVTALSI